MPKYNPNNPAHVRADKVIQGWLRPLLEAGLEVVDAEELEKLKARVILLEAELEVTDKLYPAPAVEEGEKVTTVAKCNGCGNNAPTLMTISTVGQDNQLVETPALCNSCFTQRVNALTRKLKAENKQRRSQPQQKRGGGKKNA